MKTILMTAMLALALPLSAQTHNDGQSVASPVFDFTEMEYAPAQTTFTLFAPSTAKSVKLRLYRQGEKGHPVKTVRMQRSNEPNLWQTTVKGDLMGLFYTFDAGSGETPGVFARAVGVNGKRAAIVDIETTNPDGWAEDQRPVVKSPADLVIYELHHRDFSIARNINLSPEITVKRVASQYPGKYLALTEEWAIGHLKALGINAVHILPSYDFGSVDETRLNQPQYNWGYDPVNYNVPEGSYSTDPYTPATRLREFKQMVQALHKAGIAVILDVVYNHTFDIAHSNFQLTFPDYFYRKRSDGSYSDGSGCGNETASEREMMRRFMLESVKWWYNEYHIDGFRFDLMGVHDIETMNTIRRELSAIDPSIIVYGEGWSAGACVLPTEELGIKANIPAMPGIAAFSDELRDGLRGPFSDDTKGGFLAGVAGQEESVKYGIVGGIAHPQIDMQQVNYSNLPWATEPTQMIAYVSCHDDMCLADRLMASVPSLQSAGGDIKKLSTSQLEELIRLDLLAQTAVFTSQGVPFMLSGEELLRTKKGVHNSFSSPDSVNQLDWSAPHKYPQVLAYYRNLIALRKHHPAFRLGDAHLVRKHLEFLGMPKGVVAFRLKDYAGRDDWRNIIVILNANREAASVTIPEGNYVVVCRDGEVSEDGHFGSDTVAQTAGGRITVSPQSALILHN